MTHVHMLSLEPWDDVWRRNQHLASRLVAHGWADSLSFVCPPAGGLAVRARREVVLPGITAVTPPLVVPRRHGGHAALYWWGRRQIRPTDAVWVNDPVAGLAAVGRAETVVYDVTDDWRSMPQSAEDRRRIVRAEDVLATTARTVVCSTTLRSRWHERYGVDAVLIPNAVDVAAVRRALPHDLEGPGPHAVYVGTLHENRIDVDLLARFIADWPGTVHLVGPWHLAPRVSSQWRALGAHIVGPVPSPDVPRWLNAADVLICPHLVDAFTLSLDAIKAHEYLATDRPIVATPTSSFQDLAAPGLAVVAADDFTHAALRMSATHRRPGGVQRDTAVDWDARAEALADVLGLTSRIHPPGRP